MKNWLSKSTYLRSLKCDKSLYLYKNYFHLRDKPSAKKLQLFKQGHDIETQVRQLFHPKGINVAPPHPKSWGKSIAATKLLILNQQPVIYEAAFSYEGIMCAVDITTISNKKLTLFEIKRGAAVKQVYLEDVAFQYHVIASAGYTIEDFFLVNCIGDPQADVFSKDDFTFTSVLDYCQRQQTSVDAQVRQAEKTVQQVEIPVIEMGEHCHQPYDCDFMGLCRKSAIIE